MPPPATPGEALIADLTAAGTAIVAHLARAYSGDPKESIALAHFTEANFPGYAPVTITEWEDVEPGRADVAHVLSGGIYFEASEAISSPQEVVAVYYTATKEGAGTILYKAEIFPRPFTFIHPGDSLERQLRVQETLADGVPLIE